MIFSRRWLFSVFAVAIILILLVVVVVLYFPKSQPSQASLVAGDRTALEARAQITVPTITTSTIIDVAQLPSFLRLLVLPQATGTVAMTVLYAGSLRGYKITYLDREGVQDAYRSFADGMGRGNWAPTQGAQSQNFAYFEIVGNGLQGRAEFSVRQSNLVAVTLWVFQR